MHLTGMVFRLFYSAYRPYRSRSQNSFLLKNTSGKHLDEKKQYILLLDIRMPKVDGLEVLKIIKKDQRLKKIPVIMLTTTSDTNMINQCYELGCSYYMVKPVNYHNFMDTVQNLGEFLSLKGMRLPLIENNHS